MSEITITGLQHIGLPTNDMKATVAFYEKLGFTVAYRTMNNGEEVVFLKHGSLCIESYENGQAKKINGAIDHIAMDVEDVEKAWEEVKALGITPIEDRDPGTAFLGKRCPLFQHIRPEPGKN